MKPKEMLTLTDAELFQTLTENVKRKVLEKFYPITNEVKRRIEFELAEIKKRNFAKNLLILEDIAEYADKTNIPVGYGRKKATSSILNFILGITKINPIEWSLFSELFYDENNINIPLVELDFGKHSLIK